MSLSLASIAAFLTSPTGTMILALIGAWVGGKGLVAIVQNPRAAGFLGHVLDSAKMPGSFVGKWLQAGPLHVLAGPIICLLVFAGFWFFTFIDQILDSQKPDVQKLVEAMERMLIKTGSTDRRLYIQAKSLTASQSQAVSKMADAVAAVPFGIDPEQSIAIKKAQAIGAEFQARRLAN